MTVPSPVQPQNTISLAGAWRFAVDNKSDDLFKGEISAELIPLPGTTDEAQKGNRNDQKEYDRLTRRFLWTGAAWYQRTIEIPAEWKGKRVELLMERTKTTRVWFDNTDCGSQESLVTAHVYELTRTAVPGKYRLTILVDNANHPPVGRSHQIAEHTQSNWNGIVGRIELRATDSVWLEHVRVDPDYEKRAFRVVAAFGGEAVNAGAMNVSVGPHEVEVRLVAGAHRAEATLALGADTAAWDEWSQTLQRVSVDIQGTSATGSFHDKRETTAGLCAFTAKGTLFNVNGRTTFLRGKHDACVFPLTGYAPMNKEAWKAQMAIAKTYGINHYRFHSWCPPAAAFEAADELGIYLQPELPFWDNYGGQAHYDYMLREGKRILDAYGNHPSFVMMTLGNELHGSHEMMGSMVAALRAHDPRHLYAQGSNNFHGDPRLMPGDDFWVTMRTRKEGGNVRGSFARVDKPSGAVQTGPANTLGDYSDAIKGVAIPVIGHEVGQYQVFPDFKEIPRYTGVFEARNFMLMRDRLQERGMLEQADDFVQASGRLSAICYREDMELAWRTRGMGGFQLLDLQDFPGQGTALIGILNAFMESKGLITPEEWRQACDQRVLLARLPGYTWTTDKTLTCAVELANFGPDALPAAEVEWQLKDTKGGVRSSGRLPAVAVAQGVVGDMGRLALPLGTLPAPARYTLALNLKNGSVDVANEYPLWVYPAQPAPIPGGDGVRVSDWLDAATLQHLSKGGTVLLAANATFLPEGQSVPGFFTPDFWCWPMFHNPSGVMGLLMDPKHPALAGFPTEFHGNWQWFDILMASTPIVLDAMPSGHRPIVQVIDNFDRCHRLGLVDGFTHNGGRVLLVACEAGKLESSVAGVALLNSLRAYAASESFKPAQPMPASLAESLAREERGQSEKRGEET